jgi:hypothetical protein
MDRLRAVHWDAIAVGIAGVAVALALPMYRCEEGYRFRDYSRFPGGGPTCFVSDVGYRPHSWLPVKVSVAAGGIVVAAAILLWQRRRFVAIGGVIAFTAIVVAWFIPDGFEQTMRDGRPVCCGREISREWLRNGIVIAGVGLGAAFVLIGLWRARTIGSATQASREPPSNVAPT